MVVSSSFTWARFVVEYRNGVRIYEDRSDPDCWVKLPKKNISAIGIEVYHPYHTTHMLDSRGRNCRFFQYKRRSKSFGLTSGVISTTDLAMGVGMVFNSAGDCIVLEVDPDGSCTVEMRNVIEDGRNLDLHGIDLTELDER